MKKWFLVIAFCTISFGYAEHLERTETLSCKITLENKEGYYVLSDGSCWKVVGFSKRWRSIREWWNDVQLVPKSYECFPEDWYLGSPIGIYDKYLTLEVNEADAANQEVLQKCSHLFVNGRTREVLFASPMHPAECMMQLFNDARNEGYQEGYRKGRLDAYQNGNDIYNEGRAEGYKAGYAEGVQAFRSAQ